MLDVGCGAGTECQVWAELGHSVTGIDISEPLVQLSRSALPSRDTIFILMSGPLRRCQYAANSFDVCLIPQLLEHVPDWQKCLDEGARGSAAWRAAVLSTTNVICPVQNEFELPLYSWYPKFVKRRCEKLAVTTHREWVSHTSYPAVHWFTFWQLKQFLATKGLTCFDRFELGKGDRMSAIRRVAFALIRRLPPLRFAAYLLVVGTIVVGVKTPDTTAAR